MDSLPLTRTGGLNVSGKGSLEEGPSWRGLGVNRADRTQHRDCLLLRSAGAWTDMHKMHLVVFERALISTHGKK